MRRDGEGNEERGEQRERRADRQTDRERNGDKDWLIVKPSNGKRDNNRQGDRKDK